MDINNYKLVKLKLNKDKFELWTEIESTEFDDNIHDYYSQVK